MLSINILKKGKDKAVSFGIEKVLSSLIQEYGKMLDFKIDSSQNKITFSALLDGEHDKIDINIGKYEIITRGDKTYLIVSQLSTSRAWVNKLISECFTNYEIEIPKKFTTISKLLL